MERTSNSADAIVRFRTTKPPPGNSALQLCTNRDPKQEFVETIPNLERGKLYNVQVSAWEQGSDRSKAVKLLIKEQAVNQELMFARINLPLRTMDIYRSVQAKSSPEQLLQGLRERERKCTKGGDVQLNESIFPIDKSARVQSLIAKGLISGTAIANEADGARFVVNDADRPRNSDFEFQYKVAGSSGRIAGSGIAMLASAKATSEESITFPDPQLTVAERVSIRLNKSRPFRFEWNLRQPDSAGFITVQLGYAGQNSYIYCVFDAKAGSGDVPQDLMKDLPSGKHDMAISAVSFQLSPLTDSSLVPWIISIHDWRIARFQVL
jgi:hypothetical protein